MSKKKVIVPNELIAKYKTGEYTLSKLSKMYNIPRTTLIDYMRKNNITITDTITDTINTLDNGYKKLSNIVNYSLTDTLPTQEQEINSLVVNEVIEIVKSKNPMFAEAIQSVSIKLLKVADFLSSSNLNAKDVKNLTGALKDINDTLQVIPKPPMIAQQFNFNKEQQKQESNNKKEVIISYEILDNKK